MTIELRHLRHAQMLAASGSFASAAIALNLTQPALSRSIKTLEDVLGVRLFERSQRGIVLTQAGSRFLRSAKSVLESMESLSTSMRDETSGVGGTTSFGIAPLPSEALLLPALEEILKVMPTVKAYAQTQSVTYLVQELRVGNVDFILCPLESLSPAADLSVRKIGRFPLNLLARKDHPLADKPLESLAEIARYPLLGAPTGYGQSLSQFSESTHFAALGSLHMASINYGFLHEIASRSEAVCLGSEAAARSYIDQGRLIVLDTRKLPLPEAIEMAIVTIPTRAMPQASGHAADVFARHCKNVGSASAAV